MTLYQRNFATHRINDSKDAASSRTRQRCNHDTLEISNPIKNQQLVIIYHNMYRQMIHLGSNFAIQKTTKTTVNT